MINVLIRFVKDPVSSEELLITHSQYSTVENSNSDLVSYIDPEKNQRFDPGITSRGTTSPGI